MTAKEELRQLFILRHEMQTLEIEIEDLRHMQVTANYSVNVVGHSASYEKIFNVVEKITKYEKLLMLKMKEYVDVCENIKNKIEQVSKPKYVMILKYKYINGLTFERIAEITNYDISWVYRLHKEALKKYQKISAKEYIA